MVLQSGVNWVLTGSTSDDTFWLVLRIRVIAKTGHRWRPGCLQGPVLLMRTKSSVIGDVMGTAQGGKAQARPAQAYTVYMGHRTCEPPSGGVNNQPRQFCTMLVADHQSGSSIGPTRRTRLPRLAEDWRFSRLRGLLYEPPTLRSSPANENECG